MNKKIVLIIGIIVMAMVAVVCFGFSLGVFNSTTDVDTVFIKGTIQGDAIKADDIGPKELNDWIVGYYDITNNIGYSFSMADTLNFTVNGYAISNDFEKIGTKKYNGNEWTIYAFNSNNKNTKSIENKALVSDVMDYMCVCSGKNGDYLIMIGEYDNETNESKTNLNFDSPMFTDYVAPLLNSIVLKDPKNPIEEYKTLNLTKSDYDIAIDYANQYGWSGLF
ncbi:MAG: hypothetical protein LBM96_04195 [Methanobrevibacter sp.]|jgi:hypothetical protein|nr:hypothetical protein [Candidatus Methanoflexus mossambicus]